MPARRACRLGGRAGGQRGHQPLPGQVAACGQAAVDHHVGAERADPHLRQHRGQVAAAADVTVAAKPGAWPIPPPSTISSGSTTVITQQIARATSRPPPRRPRPPARRPGPRRRTPGGPTPPPASRPCGPRGPRRTRAAAASSGPAAGVLASAARPLRQRHERDLARDPVHAAAQLAAEHQPHADAGADVDEGEALAVPPVAVGALGQRRRVNVVLERHRQPERLAQARQRGGPVPAGQPAGQRDRVPAAGRRRRGCRSRSGSPPAWTCPPGAQLVGQPDQLGHPAADAGRPRPCGEARALTPPGQVGHRAAHVLQRRCRGRARTRPPAGPRTAAPTARAPRSAAPRSAPAPPAPRWPARATRSAWTARRCGPARRVSTGRGPGCARAAAARSCARMSGGRAADSSLVTVPRT